MMKKKVLRFLSLLGFPVLVLTYQKHLVGRNPSFRDSNDHIVEKRRRRTGTTVDRDDVILTNTKLNEKEAEDKVDNDEGVAKYDDIENKEVDYETTTTNMTTKTPNAALTKVLSSAKNMNATALSLSACEQIEMTIAFITSLDFDSNFWQSGNFSAEWLEHHNNNEKTPRGRHRKLQQTNKSQFGAIWEVYLLQIILTPISIALAFAGSNLIMPTCCIAAAFIGIFLVFHVVDFLGRSKSLFLQSLYLNMDCQMKLAISAIMAFVSAMLATSCLRFGIFSMGALAAGGIMYLIFDAFPFLDPTRPPEDTENEMLHGQFDSELSPFGWIVTTLVGVGGGLFLRWYEQASLEVVTAAMGGLGCAYSLHTFVILHGGKLDRSLVFLIVNIIAFWGWRVQRRRRLFVTEYSHKKQEAEEELEFRPLLVTPAGYNAAALPPQIQSWNDLQTSVNSLLKRTQQDPSEDQIKHLTNSLNTLLQKMESGSAGKSIDDDDTNKDP